MEKILNFTFKSKGQEIKLGSGTSYGIVTYSGIAAPDVLLAKTQNVLQDGSAVSGIYLIDRLISVTAELSVTQNQELNRQQLIHFFNPKTTGNLIVNYCGIERNIDYIVNKFDVITPATLWENLSFTIDLICPKPYWNDMDSFGKNIAHITKQFAFPLGIPMGKGKIMGYKTFKREVLLNNPGDAATGVEIVFVALRGTVVNPKLIKASTGEYLRAVLTMQKGDRLTFNTNERSKRVELNGENVIHLLDRHSTFFNIDVGDNLLRYDADENYINIEVRPYYTPKYLGV